MDDLMGKVTNLFTGNAEAVPKGKHCPTSSPRSFAGVGSSPGNDPGDEFEHYLVVYVDLEFLDCFYP